MTLDKAMEILAESAYHGSTTFNEDYKDAQKLGIEALKRLKEHREDQIDITYRALPGETEE